MRQPAFSDASVHTTVTLPLLVAPRVAFPTPLLTATQDDCKMIPVSAGERILIIIFIKNSIILVKNSIILTI